MPSSDLAGPDARSPAAMFAALGAEGPLNLFVRLLRSGPAGLSRGEIEDPGALDDLSRVGLVRVQRIGRTEIFHAEPDALIESLADIFRSAREPS